MREKIDKILSGLFPEYWKNYTELRYWKNQKKKEGALSNDHYSYFYTTHFGLTEDDYRGKRILDIGCGPRGSLEWANMAKRRIGLDPLADKYLKLGAMNHQMEYLAAPSEKIPFDSSYFDIVCSFNSFDHVADVKQTIAEIKRVLKPDGLFLLLVEIYHEPTSCEPHMITPEILGDFAPELKACDVKVYKPVHVGMYDSVIENDLFRNPHSCTEHGWLSVKFRTPDST